MTKPMPNHVEPMLDHLGHAAPGFLAWVGELVHAHRRELLSYARRQGLAAEDALDAVQDGFVSFMKLPQARTIAAVPEDAIKMLMVLIKHDVKNHRRKHQRHNRIEKQIQLAELTPPQSSEELIAVAEELARVNGCILRMAELQRRVVMLSLLDECPVHEVAQTLGIAEGYVRVLIHRAREHVRTCNFSYDQEHE